MTLTITLLCVFVCTNERTNENEGANAKTKVFIVYGNLYNLIYVRLIKPNEHSVTVCPRSKSNRDVHITYSGKYANNKWAAQIIVHQTIERMTYIYNHFYFHFHCIFVGAVGPRWRRENRTKLTFIDAIEVHLNSTFSCLAVGRTFRRRHFAKIDIFNGSPWTAPVRICRWRRFHLTSTLDSDGEANTSNVNAPDISPQSEERQKWNVEG